MIFLQFVIYVLNDNYLKFRKDPSIISQDIVNYISVALVVALSVEVRSVCYITGNCSQKYGNTVLHL